jgi:hypothetical protein
MKMSEEERIGRAWAEMMGKRPNKERGAGYGWYIGDRFESHACLPAWFLTFFDANFGGWEWRDTEAKAYAALGKALLAIWKAVPRVPICQ